MISEQVLDRLQESVSLVEVVREAGLNLEKSGNSDYKCPCPFHGDSDPSFIVGDRTFHCFGCGEKGNVFQFLMKHKKASFIDAVKEIAKKAKLDFGQIDVNEAQIQHESRERNRAIMDAAVSYWVKCYKSNTAAKKYVASRSISAAVADTFKVGFDDGNLIPHLVADLGFDPKDVKSLGLVAESGGSKLINRITFPIFKDGRVVNVCGRSIEKDPKIRYLNLKSNEGLFNYDAARKFPEVYAVEGVIDALVMISKGINNVVAQLGTQGFKDEYIAALAHSGVKRISMIVDHDVPKQGKKEPESWHAGCRTAARILNRGIDVCLSTPPGVGQDPADYFAGGGTEKQLTFKEPLRWQHEHATTYTESPLVALRLSELGAGPDKHKEFELKAGKLRWRLTKTVQSSSGLKGLLVITDESGTEVFKDRCDLWSSARRAAIAKGANLDSKLVNKICTVLERQFDILSENDREERKRIRAIKSGSNLPEYASELAEAMKSSTSLITDITNDITALGYVGEDNNKTLLYMVAVSALMPEPLGCYIASDSGAGKSAMVEAVAKMFPPEHVVMISRMTDQALYYVKEDELKHRWLVVAERQGAESEAADYNLRTFFSEKQLTLMVPMKDEQTGKIETKRHTVYGPIAYTETTTSVGIHDENATRLIEMNIREGEDQTAAVHEHQRKIAAMTRPEVQAIERERRRVMMKHRAFIKGLRPVEVRIPYASLITFPTHLTRARRDLLKFLNLIKVVAFIHQHQRPVEEADGIYYIDATPEDYAVAYDLSRDTIRKAFAAVPERSQDLLKEIFGVLKDSKTGMIDTDDPELCTFTLKDIVSGGVKRSIPTIKKYMAPLIEQDLIEVLDQGKQGRGNASKYKIKVPTLEDAEDPTNAAILKPEELKQKVAAIAKAKPKPKATKKEVDELDEMLK